MAKHPVVASNWATSHPKLKKLAGDPPPFKSATKSGVFLKKWPIEKTQIFGHFFNFGGFGKKVAVFEI